MPGTQTRSSSLQAREVAKESGREGREVRHKDGLRLEGRCYGEVDACCGELAGCLLLLRPTLGDGLGHVAGGVEPVGGVAHELGLLAHLRNAA